MKFKWFSKVIFCIAAVCLAGHPARAGFHTWTGAVNGYWSNTNNWSGGSAPEVFETPPVEIDFPSGTGRLHTTNDIGFIFLGGLYGLQVDSIIVGDNYTFSGNGYGTNIWFSGNPAPFFGINLQNFYIPTANITVTFDQSLYLNFQGTNTITNAASSTLDIQSTLLGAGGWTFQGSGELVLDGPNNIYATQINQNNLTGTCDAQAGIVVLNRWDVFDGVALPVINGPLIIGTTNTANSAIVFEYNTNGCSGGQFGAVSGAQVPVTILPSGFLYNYGVNDFGISTLTMTGGQVVFGSENYVVCGYGCATNTIYGFISATNITTYAPPSGAPSIIESSEPGNNFNYEGVDMFWVSSGGGTNPPAIINVVSGTLNVSACLFGAYNTNMPTLIKTGPGTLGLLGTNEYLANTIIQQGLVVAGGDQPFGQAYGGNNPYYDAYYDLPANSVMVPNGTEIVTTSPLSCPVPLVLNGYGTNGNGAALLVLSNGASFANVTLGSDSAVLVDSTAVAAFGIFGSHFNSVGSGSYSYSPLDGSANFHKLGQGTLQLIGHFRTNAISGTTYVDQGTLTLDGVTNYASTNIADLINGPLIFSTNGGIFVQAQSAEPITSAYPIVIYPADDLNILSNARQTASSLTLNGGSVDGGGTLVLNGNVTAQVTALVYPSLSSVVSLNGTNRVFNVPYASALEMFGTVTDGGNGAGVIKIGLGDLDLYGAVNCAGPMLVTTGNVNVLDSGVFSPTGGGVVATNAADLLLYNGINIGAAPLWLAGTGSDGYGPLKSYGTNSWAGTVTLVSNVTLEVFTNSSYPGSQLELSGVITGPGGLTKIGGGNLLLDGGLSNNYAGTTVVQQGPLTLSKTNALAIPGPLTIGLGLDGPNGDAVHTLLGYQLSSNNTVNISSSGLLDVSAPYSYVTSIGSLTGSGSVQLGGNGLDCGYDNTSTTYSGTLNGIGGGYLLKYGTGALTLTGSSSFPGILQCEAGQLFVNGSMPSAIASFTSGSLLGGTGTVGPFGFTHGTLAPGNNGPGILTSGNVFLNTNDTFLAYITGTLPGTYSELSTTGTVSLNGVHLQLNMPVAGVTNSQLTLINKSTTNAVSGTFFGLPEGSTITAANGAKFTITYHSGAHNNVVLTQISLPTPSAFTGIIKLGGGNIQLNGSGAGNTPYTVWANTNLATTNWITIGTATANGVGQIQFTDTNAPLYQQCFYRFSWP